MLITSQQVGTTRSAPGGVGFIRGLKLLRTTDVLALLAPNMLQAGQPAYTISKAGIAVQEKAVVTELLFPSRGCSFSETPELDRNGKAYTVLLETGVPRANAELMGWLDKNAGHRWIALFQETGGQTFLAGEPGNGLQLSTARNLTDLNRMTLTLGGKFSRPLYFLESYSNADLFPDAAFDYSFDLSYDA